MGRYYGPHEYPSITTALNVLVRFEGIDRDVLARKAMIGTAVHKYTAAIDAGISWFSKGIPPKIDPYIQQWKILKAEHIERIIWIEKPLISETFKYGGKMDLFGILRGHRFPAVIQKKTSAMLDRFLLMQVAAEMQLARENYKKKIEDQGYVAQLWPDGYKFLPLYEKPEDYANAFQGFQFSLWLFHYLNGGRE